MMMGIETATRCYGRTHRSVFDRLEGQHYVKNQVCKYWLAGKCNRNPCRFRHSDLPNQQPKQSYNQSSNKLKSTRRSSNLSNSKNGTVSSAGVLRSDIEDSCLNQKKVSTTDGSGPVAGCSQKAHQKLCQYWVTGNCVHGDKCKDLHSWFSGSGFSLLTKLERHNKAITGIALPSGSDKLFSGSKDECVCVWDCHSGQCVTNAKPGGEIGCLITDGPWVFVGLHNAVTAWNIQFENEFHLTGPAGLVKAMAVGDDILFGGAEDGSILAWKFNAESGSPELVATLKGHKLAVLSLVVGANMLYSGSKDGTIKQWDLKTLQCLQTVNGHTNSVTSLICWECYLLSGSLDNTLKAWATSESGSLEVVYEVKEESGILALSGIQDAEAKKDILLCSCKDNTVRLYDLPSFAEMGRIFAKTRVEALAVGCGGLFFTGDATGQLSVWKLLGRQTEETTLS